MIETDQSTRAARMKMLLTDALHLKQKIPEGDFNRPNINRAFIDKQISRLLAQEIADEPKSVKAFFKRINKNRKYLLEFLYHTHVPPDNNASERAIRNANVKQKISTQFKSASGIVNYAIIRSVFDTCLKRRIGIFETSNLAMPLGAAK